jgi:hypothetical protein
MSLLARYMEEFPVARTLTLDNMIERVVILMRWAEALRGKSGPEKKELVLDLVRSMVDDHDDQTTTFAEVALPGLVDALIAVDKSRIKIRKPLLCLSCLP